MVTAGMRRYKVRTDLQATLIGERGSDRLDLVRLFPPAPAPSLLRLEIGFGHGEFISALARAHPDDRFIGIEHDDLRVTKTAHKCNKDGLANVRLFGDNAQRFVRTRLPAASVDRIYILFPDPWPKLGHRRRRLLTRSFLLDLSHAAAPGCHLVMASDTHEYVFQCLSNLSTLPTLWRNRYLPAGYRFDIGTRFPTLFERHKKAEGCRIAYLSMERTASPAPPPVAGERSWSGPVRPQADG
jgi:tRNA (guanine-N7-)-methyltransferase